MPCHVLSFFVFGLGVYGLGCGSGLGLEVVVRIKGPSRVSAKDKVKVNYENMSLWLREKG
jgi:hypothetical protein